MADHIWIENGNHRPLLDKIEIKHREHHWNIQKHKKSVFILGYKNPLRRPSIAMNTIQEQVIQRDRK